MKVAPIADVKTHFSRFVDECREDPVIVTRNGRAAALLIAIDADDDLETLLLGHSRRLRRLLDASDASISRGEGIPHDAFWQHIEGSEKVKKPRRRAKAARR